MKARVIESLCIGCGACTVVNDEFDLNDDGIAYALNETVKDENAEKVKEAKDNCPMDAIVIEE